MRFFNASTWHRVALLFGIALASLALPAYADLYYHCVNDTIGLQYSEVGATPTRSLQLLYPGGATVSYPNDQITVTATVLGRLVSVSDTAAGKRKITFVLADAVLSDTTSHPFTGFKFATLVKTGPITEINKVQRTSCTVASQSSSGQTFTLGGQVSAGSPVNGLILINNGIDSLDIASAGPFAFPAAYPAGSTYSVTAVPASNSTCTVSNGSGLLSAAVTDVAVTCTCRAGSATCGSEDCHDLSTDVHNCGGCGVDCGEGNQCASSICSVPPGKNRGRTIGPARAPSKPRPTSNSARQSRISITRFTLSAASVQPAADSRYRLT